MSNKDLEDFLNSIPGLPKQQEPDRREQQNGCREIDIGSMLQQRIIAKQMQQQVPQQQPTHNFNDQQFQRQDREMIYLREGQTYYKAIPAQESPLPLAIYAGPISNSTGKEFLNKGARKYYVVEGNQAVDLSNPDYSKMKVLYAVEAPWVGTILVPESAIMRQNAGRKLLND